MLSRDINLRRLWNASVAIKNAELLSGVKEALFTNILNLLIRIPEAFLLTRLFPERQ